MSREGYRKRLSLAFSRGRPLITPLGYFPQGFILGASASALSMDTKQPRALVVPGATVWVRKPWPTIIQTSSGSIHPQFSNCVSRTLLGVPRGVKA